jgi:sugar-specific transcriptional regulator TrmB
VDLINQLQEIGLSKREAEVYLALLQKKEFTAPDIAKITTITRTKVYEILQNLVKKGLCNESYKDAVKVYRGVDPKIAITNILEIYQQELENKKKIAENFEKALSLIYTENQSNYDPLDYIEVVKDKGQIKQRWLKLEANTKKELLIFTKSPYTGSLEDNIEDQNAITSRKVKVKSIYESKDVNSRKDKEEFVRIIESYVSTGEEARIIKQLPMKLVISDESVTMFALNDPVSLQESITTLIVNHPSFAIALKNVFNSYWEKGYTLKEYRDKF